MALSGQFEGFPFLATKLLTPPEQQHLVPRARLADALEHSLPTCRLILLSAPAGYGKSTLLAQWARSSRFPVAWLSVGEEDNDLERFLRYLLAAWEKVRPGVMKSPLGLLLGALSPDTDAVLTAFINAAADEPDHLAFVLDDYHLIKEPAIQRAMTFLLDHLPSNVHFVLAGRGTPALPLARYRARHELLELRAEDLQFLAGETALFLNQRMQLDLPEDQVTALQDQLEGWIAGLQLAALTLRQRPHGKEPLMISGKHRFIADYLSEEVLAHLPDRLQHFLLQTSILDRLSGPLCDAVTENEGAQEVLEFLEREHLFLVALDDSREWFRYHGLFADFLRSELNRRDPSAVIGLQRRAAAWYLAHDMPEPAFRHAVDGDDAELAAKVGEHNVYLKLAGGDFTLVKRWLDSIPAKWYSAQPIFSLARVAYLLFTGDVEAGVRCLDEVEQRLLQEDSQVSRGLMARVTAIRCFIACYQNDVARAEAFASRALQELPGEDLDFRPNIYGALGDTYRRNGRWEEARECYLKTLDFSHAPTVRMQSVHLFGALADLALRRGQLRNAAAFWRKALAATQESETWGWVPLPVSGWVYVRMAEILYEWDMAEETWNHVSRGLERAELGGDVLAMIAGYLIAARAKLTDGDVETAAEYLEKARPLVENAAYPDWQSRFERCQSELWLAQGRHREAVRWSLEMMQGDAIERRPESEPARLVIARVLILKGDVPAFKRSQAMLARMATAMEEDGRMGVYAEVLALQAIAAWKLGEQASAMTILEHALRLAEPEGYRRLFADMGLPMARLLQEARTRAVMPEYVEQLLATFGGEAWRPEGRTVPEPLTAREQQVLQLIAAGLTNHEIAEKLVLSAETVKKHTGNIFGKLGVNSRTQAVAKAREMDLLP